MSLDTKTKVKGELAQDNRVSVLGIPRIHAMAAKGGSRGRPGTGLDGEGALCLVS